MGFGSTDNSLLYIHRNHHFDTIQRLHPLLHPLHPGIELGYSSFYGQLQSSLFFHEKRDITALGKQYLFLLIIVHLSRLLQPTQSINRLRERCSNI